MGNKRKLRKPRNEIRKEVEKLGFDEKNTGDEITSPRKLSERGGIYRWLRDSPLVGANLNLKRERVKPRKVDI